MADFDADAVREQMAQAHFDKLPDAARGFWDEGDSELLLSVVTDALPIAVRAVTDAVRELHPEHQCHPGLFEGPDMCFIVHGGVCAKKGGCSQCGGPSPCPTQQLCDEIDKAAGVQRNE